MAQDVTIQQLTGDSTINDNDRLISQAKGVDTAQVQVEIAADYVYNCIDKMDQGTITTNTYFPVGTGEEHSDNVPNKVSVKEIMECLKASSYITYTNDYSVDKDNMHFLVVNGTDVQGVKLKELDNRLQKLVIKNVENAEKLATSYEDTDIDAMRIPTQSRLYTVYPYQGEFVGTFYDKYHDDYYGQDHTVAFDTYNYYITSPGTTKQTFFYMLNGRRLYGLSNPGGDKDRPASIIGMCSGGTKYYFCKDVAGSRITRAPQYYWLVK